MEKTKQSSSTTTITSTTAAAIALILVLHWTCCVEMRTPPNRTIVDINLQTHRQNQPENNNLFEDVHFWHAMERFLVHIKPDVLTEDGIEMPVEEEEEEPVERDGGKPRENIRNHGYMHVLYDEMERQTLSEDAENTGNDRRGTTIVGIEPIHVEDLNFLTTTLTFNLSSMQNLENVHDAELAFSQSNDIGKQHDSLTVEIVVNDNDIETYRNSTTKMLIRNRPDLAVTYSLLDIWPMFQNWCHRRTGMYAKENSILSLRLSTGRNHVLLESPLLVLYAKTNLTRAEAEHHTRRVRSAHLPPRTCKRCAYAERKRPLGGTTTSIKQTRNQHDTCGLRQWYVTLGDLRWDTWVIAPSGFRMDYCSGPCQAPIVDTLYNATNHAVVRSMLLAGQLTDKMPDIPPPYCVPIKLRSTNIMYQESGQFVIKNLDNIIAEQCGCS